MATTRDALLGDSKRARFHLKSCKEIRRRLGEWCSGAVWLKRFINKSPSSGRTWVRVVCLKHELNISQRPANPRCEMAGIWWPKMILQPFLPFFSKFPGFPYQLLEVTGVSVVIETLCLPSSAMKLWQLRMAQGGPKLCAAAGHCRVCRVCQTSLCPWGGQVYEQFVGVFVNHLILILSGVFRFSSTSPSSNTKLEHIFGGVIFLQIVPTSWYITSILWSRPRLFFVSAQVHPCIPGPGARAWGIHRGDRRWSWGQVGDGFRWVQMGSDAGANHGKYHLVGGLVAMNLAFSH